MFKLLKQRLEDFYDFYYTKLKPIFSPKHKTVRKAVARGYSDLVQVIVDVNFAIIKEFYEEEYLNGIVDWQATETDKEFAKWLENSYLYITEGKNKLETQLAAAYPETPPFDEMWKEIEDVDSLDKQCLDKDSMELKSCEEIYGKPFEEVYADVNILEKLIEDTDTKILTEMIRYRGFFWT